MPDAGTVTVDGHDLRTVTLDSYRSQLGVVLQSRRRVGGHRQRRSIRGHSTRSGRLSPGQPGRTNPVPLETASPRRPVDSPTIRGFSMSTFSYLLTRELSIHARSGVRTPMAHRTPVGRGMKFLVARFIVHPGRAIADYPELQAGSHVHLELDPEHLEHRTFTRSDPIHVFVRLDQRKVLNSRCLRLRHIHQLALTYLVYPGATTSDRTLPGSGTFSSHEPTEHRPGTAQ